MLTWIGWSVTPPRITAPVRCLPGGPSGASQRVSEVRMAEEKRTREFAPVEVDAEDVTAARTRMPGRYPDLSVRVEPGTPIVPA
jgi:hypothetical protein